jgi:hypothetical protein
MESSARVVRWQGSIAGFGITSRKRNRLNILLMVGSAWLAWVWPFELFLFAYGVLGPLHYLTEISWLHDRHWFGRSSRDWIGPTVAAIGGTIAYVVARSSGGMAPITIEVRGASLSVAWSELTTVAALGFAATAVLVGRAGRKAMLAAAVGVAGLLVVQTNGGRALVSVFLLTLVHVLVFTSAFILHGALREGSPSGYLSWAIHLAVPAVMLSAGWASPGSFVVSSADLRRAAPVHDVLLGICTLFGVPADRPHAVSAMPVVAYAYTYHYLNWFSKTDIIRWHRVPRARLVWLGAAWVASVVFYIVDWSLMFVLLLALSVAHVYLEFPLNWRTLVSIGRALKTRAVAA